MVMSAYTPKVYVNDREPPINASNLNSTEQQIKLLTDVVRNIQISLESGQFKEALDQIKQLAESAAKTAEWDQVSGKPELLKIGTTSTTAKRGDFFQKAIETSVNPISGIEGDNVQTILEGLAVKVKALEDTP